MLLTAEPIQLNIEFRMQETEIDPQQLQKQRKMWKMFGRETKAGKELFNLYNLTNKPKIDYPKPKPKSQKEIEREKQKMTETKKCPQKTQIQYPQMSKPQKNTYHAIDFVPKRKNESVIRKQIEEYYRRRAIDIPANRGVDRANLVKILQQKFKQQRGGLPKGAQLPQLTQKFVYDQQKAKENAKLKVQKKFRNFTVELKQKSNDPKKSKNEQLNELFDCIVAQIDQRQAYLESIEHLDEPKIKQRVKQQMIQRVGQLQRITELKNK